ncbi:MAG: Periplasmic serine endoprotease DegP [Phycisphaerae bacterium]|nr:Periplasmic serine endoprotease DegP [Phycisphaerae bacterium]
MKFNIQPTYENMLQARSRVRAVLILSLPVLLICAGLISGLWPQNVFADEPAAGNPRRTPIVDVFERTHDAVVNISSTQLVKVRRSPFDLFFDDSWDRGFDQPRYKKLSSVGSGFVIHPSGYIITNAHVVNRASDVKIIFDDERQYDAEIVAADHEHDLALLKINSPSPLPTIHLGRSDDLLIGETVIAIGNPLGFQHSLTTGVISATQRDLQFTDPNNGKEVTYAGLIQTDAPINPGNSGGPLLNILGELIGINTAIRGDAQNIGFAIPVQTLRDFLPVMLRSEIKNRLLLGFSINAEREVVEVWDDSPAAQAGIVVGDRLTRLNQITLSSDAEFYFELLRYKPGQTLTLDLQHEQQERSVQIKLLDRPRPDGGQLAWSKLGLRLEPLPDELAKTLRIHSASALLIKEVEKNSPAERIGIVAGDVLTLLGGFYVSNLDEVGQILESINSGEKLSIAILRIEGNILYRDGANITAR